MNRALVMLSVVLNDDSDEPKLTVEFDPTSTGDAAVDVRADGSLLVSCSLDDLEQFAEHLGTFIGHHRAATEAVDPEPEYT